MSYLHNYGIRITNEKLEPLRPVLDAWINCIIQYVELFDGGDLPYWFNERANVSILSAAAWKAGMVALEEFPSDKVPQSSEDEEIDSALCKETNPKKGRCDLYLANSDVEFFVEAKVDYPKISDKSDCFRKGLSYIAQDRRNVGSQSSIHLSALFCAPFSHKQRASEQEISNHLNLALQEPMDAHAWVIPSKAQETASHKGSYYPMVSLFLKIARSANS